MSAIIPDSPEFVEKVQKAISLHQAGDLYNAEYAYKELLLDIPDHPQINYFLACLFLNVSCYQGAILHLQHALSFEEKPSFRAALVSAFFKNRQYDSAIDEARVILEADPENYDAQYVIGCSLMELERYDEAEPVLRGLFEKNNQDPQSHSNLGELFRRQGKLGWAESAFQSALKLQDDHIDALVGLGHTHLDNNALDDAERVLRNALEKFPDDPRPHRYLGEVFYRREKYDWAVGAARSSWQKDPKNLESLMLKGKSHHVLKEYDKAHTAYRCAYFLVPTDPEVCYLYARACILNNDPHWAVGLLKSVVKDPEYADRAAELLVFAQLQAGGGANALESLRTKVLALES